MTADEYKAIIADLIKALEDFCRENVAYHGPYIHVPCGTHGEAMRRMREARAVLDKAKKL
jgi:hypothetical protein